MSRAGKPGSGLATAHEGLQRSSSAMGMMMLIPAISIPPAFLSRIKRAIFIPLSDLLVFTFYFKHFQVSPTADKRSFFHNASIKENSFLKREMFSSPPPLRYPN